jgi:LPS export ABC transporter protein LptC
MRFKEFLFVALAMPSSKPAIEILTFHLVESDIEQKSVEIWSEKARIYKTENLMVLDNLTTDIYSDSSNSAFRAKGKIGVFSSANQDFTIFGDSELTSPDNYRFKTQDLVFNAKTKTLDSKSAVEGSPNSINSGGFILKGTGLSVDTKKSAYEIKNQVTAQQITSGKAESAMVIESESAQIEPKINSAEFKSDVKVKSKEMTLSGQNMKVEFAKDSQSIKKLFLSGITTKKKPDLEFIQAQLPDLKLKANGLSVNFNQNGEFESSEAIGQASGATNDGVELWANKLSSIREGGITRIELSEKVRILAQGRDATCEAAIFYPATGEIVLNTTATIKKNDQIVEGERIRFSTKNSEIKVEKARGTMDKSELLKK